MHHCSTLCWSCTCVLSKEAFYTLRSKGLKSKLEDLWVHIALLLTAIPSTCGGSAPASPGGPVSHLMRGVNPHLVRLTFLTIPTLWGNKWFGAPWTSFLLPRKTKMVPLVQTLTSQGKPKWYHWFRPTSQGKPNWYHWCWQHNLSPWIYR